MNFILEGISSLLGKMAELVAAGGIIILNLLFAGVENAVNAVILLLPSLPEVIPPPEFVETINWFFPIGTVVSVATGLLISYGTFLAVRWILAKAGMIG